MPTSNRNKAILALIITAAGYALLSIAVRLLDNAFEPMTQVYVRVALGCLLAVVLFHKKLRWKSFKTIPRSDWLPLTVMGIIGYALAVYFITLGALHTKLVNVSVIYATLPFFVYIYSLFFLKKKIELKWLALVTVSFWGVSMIATRSFVPLISDFGKGELFTLISAALFATYSVSRKLLSPHLNNQEISVVVMAIAASTAFVLAMINGESLQLENFFSLKVLVGLAIGAGFNILATYFENFAFEHLDVLFGNQILLTENFFALLFGVFLYGEFIGLFEVVGAGLIIGGVYLSNKVLRKPA